MASGGALTRNRVASAAVIASEAERPLMAQGIQFGDVTLGNTMLF